MKAFILDKVKIGDSTSLMALLTVRYGDGSLGRIILTEEHVLAIAMTATLGVRQRILASMESLEHKGGQERNLEFMKTRDDLKPAIDANLDESSVNIRPFIHGGGLVFPASKRNASLFLAVFDPFSAAAFVVAADDCFGS